jgi:amidase
MPDAIHRANQTFLSLEVIMSAITDYEHYDGIGLAELVRKKEVTMSELVDEARRRIGRLTPKLNAVIHTLDTPACLPTSSPQYPDGPFGGVPFLLKDAHHALTGVPMCFGSKGLKGYTPSHDAEIVKRFKRAGVAIIGKTNTPEFKLGVVTEPAAFGSTRNP